MAVLAWFGIREMPTDAVDADHVGAHISEHHGTERARAKAREFDNLDSIKRPHAASPLFFQRHDTIERHATLTIGGQSKRIDFQ